MTEPSVSIVMPMRNARPFIAEAVQSVLKQQEVCIELIVIDDGSTDGSGEFVRSVGDSRIHVMAGPRKGVAAAFNAGLSKACGKYLARCDADDVFEPGRLSRQAQWLEGHMEFGAISGAFSVITRRGATVRHLDCGATAQEITDELRGGGIRTHLCTWLVRRDLVVGVHGCREFFSSAEDIDLQLRLGEACRVWFDPVPAYRYRVHDNSITHQSTRTRRKFFEDMALQFQCERRTGPDALERGEQPIVPDGQSRDVEDSRLHIQGLLMGRAWDEHQAGQRGRALGTSIKACLTRPSNIEAWKSLGALAIRGK